MTREARQLGQVQAAVLDAIKASRPLRPPSDDEISAMAAVDRSMCSHWRSGTRSMSPLVLKALSRQYGADILLPLMHGPYVLLPAEPLEGRDTTLRRGTADVIALLSALNLKILAGDLEGVADKLQLASRHISSLCPLARSKS